MCWLLSAKKQFPLSHTDVIIMWYVFSDVESGVPNDSDSLVWVPDPQQEERVWSTSHHELVLHCQQMWAS